jgi:hypothetical protein
MAHWLFYVYLQAILAAPAASIDRWRHQYQQRQHWRQQQRQQCQRHRQRETWGTLSN